MKKILTVIFLFNLYQLNQAVWSQPLDSLLQYAVNNNPKLKALQLQFEVAHLKAEEAKSFPNNPEITAGIPVYPVETRLGPQVMMIGVSQMFPWFGSLKSKEEVFISLSKAEYEKIALEKLDVYAQIKSAYINLYFIQQQKVLIEKHITLHTSLETLVSSKLESGKGLASDIIRISMKISEYTSALKKLNYQKLKHEAVINQLINKDLSSPINLTGTPDTAKMTVNIEDVKSKIAANHPMIKLLDHKFLASESKQNVIKKSGSPMIGIGLDYAMVNPRTDMMPLNNGRDILIPKVKISVPIYRKQYDSKIEQEEKIQQALHFEKEDLILSFTTKVYQLMADFEQAKIDFQLSQELINQTKAATEIVLNHYSTSGQGFEEVIKLQEQILNYELMALKAFTQQHLIVINIEKLTEF